MGAITKDNTLTEREKNMLRVFRQEVREMTEPLLEEIKKVLPEIEELRRDIDRRRLEDLQDRMAQRSQLRRHVLGILRVFGLLNEADK